MGLGLAVTFLSSTIQMRKESHSGMRAEVNFSGKRSDSDVDPVFVGGGEFLT